MSNADMDPNRMIPRTAYRMVAEELSKSRAEVERLRDALAAIVQEFDNGHGGIEESDPVVQIALSALHPLTPRNTGEQS